MTAASGPPPSSDAPPPSSRPPPSMQPGRVIAEKYRIDSLLGSGAMGTVWAATHVNLNQRVAVKLISSDYARSREARARFDAEAKAAAMLRSRYVVQIFDSGLTEQKTPYIVMEYLNGESLDDRVERAGPLSLEDAVRIVSQVAKALSRAHSQNIVHRDLKPANIFLAQTEDGEEVAKVLDFGIAKVKGGPTTQTATATGAVLGTPLFMSPEQARGLKTVDHRTDLYALGMVAYRVLTGEYAFSGEAFGDLLLHICTQPLPTIHHVAPWLPASLDDWFKRACAREPDQRYQSAEELVEALCASVGMSYADVDPSKVLVGTGGWRPSTEVAPSSALPRPSRTDSTPATVADSHVSGTTVALDTAGAGTSAGLSASQAEVVLPTGPPLGLILAGAVAALLITGGVVFFAFRASGGGEETANEPAAPPNVASPRETEESRIPKPEIGPAPSTPPAPPEEKVADAVEPKAAEKPTPATVKPRPQPVTAKKPETKPKPVPKPKPKPRPKTTGPGVDMGF